jgi:hypothetical protein
MVKPDNLAEEVKKYHKSDDNSFFIREEDFKEHFFDLYILCANN